VNNGTREYNSKISIGLSLAKKLINIPIYVIIQPVLDQNIPLPVVHVKCGRIPPVCVEEPVAEEEHLGPGVVPGVEQAEKAVDQNESAWDDRHCDQVDVCGDGHLTDFERSKNGNGHSIEKAVYVDYADKDLAEVVEDDGQLNGTVDARVLVAVDECRREKEVEVGGELGTRQGLGGRAAVVFFAGG